MSRKKTNEEFIAESRKIHGDKYDYSKVTYNGLQKKVTIICRKHGDFEQIPYSHLLGKGCRICGFAKCGGLNKSTLELFLLRARKIHGDKYNYTKVNYITSKDYVTIICPIHGEFQQTPYVHLKTEGCKKCGIDKRAKTQKKLKAKKFIVRARKIHNNKYDYSKCKYIDVYTPVTIICPLHGIFQQVPNYHLTGNGCPTCSESTGERKIREYLEKNAIEFEPQYSPPSLRSRFDFAVNHNGFKCLIEYHGEQHYKPTNFGSKESDAGLKNLIDNIRRDHKKEKWCKEHKIPLIIIPYWDYDRIDELLDDLFVGRELLFTETPEVVKKYEFVRQKTLTNHHKPIVIQ